MKLEFTNKARQDLIRLRSFFEKKNPKAARRAAERIKTVARHITDHPKMGRAVLSPTGYREDVREFPIRFGADGYLVRYQILPGTIRILRLWHFKEFHES